MALAGSDIGGEDVVARQLCSDDRQRRAIAAFEQRQVEHHARRVACHELARLGHGIDAQSRGARLVGGVEVAGQDEARRQAAMRQPVERGRSVIVIQTPAMRRRRRFEPYRITRPAPRPTLAGEQ